MILGVDENSWNQRKITSAAKIHHKNHVFSINEITEPPTPVPESYFDSIVSNIPYCQWDYWTL